MEPSTATEPLLSCEASEVGAAEERASVGLGVLWASGQQPR